MPFYEVLKNLMIDPGKHNYRRKKWENKYDHNDTAYICSIAITPANIKVVLVHKSNNTGCQFCPSAEDITAKDWYEV
jgi:hypothetical protein